MRFEVPQFIEIEDKIFGPFTWRQFIYLAGALGAVVILYFLIPVFIIFIILAFPIVALAGFLAFHRVNNRPFSLYLESMVRFFSKSRGYRWRRREQQFIKSRTHTVPISSPTKADINSSGDRIQSLSRKLELNALIPSHEQEDSK